MAMNYNAKEDAADGHPSGGLGAVAGVSGVSGAGVGAGVGTIKSRKPDNTAFKQQRLPAWQPILTAGTVLPAFFVIGLIFIPIGIGIFVTSNNIREFEVSSGAAWLAGWLRGPEPCARPATAGLAFALGMRPNLLGWL